MAKRERPVPTAPGEGTIAVSLPVALLLERSPVGLEGYLDLVRRGELDTARRPVKFNSQPSAVDKLRTAYGRDLPEGLPDLAGDVSWRRVGATWSLDVNHGEFGQGVHWWEQIAKGTGDAQLRIDGAVLPDSVLLRMPGRPLADFVEHPLLGDPRIVIRDATSYQPTRFNGMERPGSTQIRLDVPRLSLPDRGGTVAPDGTSR